ncbi:hypothetical protein ACWDG1_39800 [Streptomyces sp. NPDC001177]
MALVWLLTVLVVLLVSGAAMYVSYQHPALVQPLTMAAGVTAVLLTAIGLTFTRR